MKKFIIFTLVIVQVITLTVFLQKLSSLEDERDVLILKISKLEKHLAKTKVLAVANEIFELPKETNLKNDKNKEISVFKQELLDNDTSSEIDTVEKEITLDESAFAKMNNVSEVFEAEQMDFDWAIEYESNIEALFNNSDKFLGMGLVSTECRSTTCKIVITRSNKGSFSDAITFTSELDKEKWGIHSGFSFEHGKEGQEEYVTLWIKR